MTELNDLPEARPGPPAGNWPEYRGGSGDASVDAVLEALDAAPGLPVSEHVALYGGIHDALLAALDAEPEREG